MDRTSNACRWDFSLQMENNLRDEMIKQLQYSTGCLSPILQQFLELQNQICFFVEQACQTTPGAIFPTVDACVIPNDEKWQILISDYATTMQNSVQQYIQLWLIKTAFENSAVFYRQFAANTSDLTARLFISSLSEIKKIAARRVESALRVCINSSWEELGFCPFSFN